MNAIPSYATAVTVTLCIIVVAVMAAISYVAAREHGSDHRSAVAVTLGVGAILAAWLAAAAAMGGAEVFLGRPSNAVPAIAGGVAIPIVTGVLLTRIPAVREALAHPRVLALLTLANSWRESSVSYLSRCTCKICYRHNSRCPPGSVMWRSGLLRHSLLMRYGNAQPTAARGSSSTPSVSWTSSWPSHSA